MKVLVTGAGGFIGSHLTERLISEGHEVTAFFQYKSSASKGWLENSLYRNDFVPYFGNISDMDSVSRAVEGQDVVFHLAALIGIPYSYLSPRAYLRTNIEGTYNVLECCRIHGVGQVLVTSTSEVYGSAQYTPIDEKHPLVGQSPYSASKIAADQLAISYHRSFGLPVSLIRPFNTYGPRQSLRAIIPTIIAQALAGDRVTLGNIEAIRDFNYVDDTVDGFISVFKSSDRIYGEPFNIATNTQITIGDVAKLIETVVGFPLRLELDINRIRPKNSEVNVLIGTSEKLNKHSGWKPKTSLIDGLKNTVNWFKSNPMSTVDTRAYRV